VIFVRTLLSTLVGLGWAGMSILRLPTKYNIHVKSRRRTYFVFELLLLLIFCAIFDHSSYLNISFNIQKYRSYFKFL
jgi:hypothetical protein